VALGDYIASEIALDCADGLFSRREALRRLTLLGMTAPAAAALLASCGDDDGVDSGATDAASNESAAGGVPATESAAVPTDVASNESAAGGVPASDTAAVPTDVATTPAATAGSVAEEIRFAGPRGELIGVLATAADPSGAVLVIHENRGLTDHIRSIPPRLAADGYTALAIDLLSEEGGTAALPSEGEATAALGNAPAERLVEDLRAGLDELERRAPGAQLAAIGFCFGGGMTWQLLAAGEPRLAAAVPFYGPAPADADFSGSPNAAVLGIYAELDARVNASQESARVALVDAELVHEMRVFAGVDHAFFNDTGARYDAGAAAEAYQAMLDWFAQHLAG
jgi:carboxymethylenebutenolidase